MSGSNPVPATLPCATTSTDTALAFRSLPRRRRPASRMVPLFPAVRRSAREGSAPYKGVLDLGWTLDEQGRAHSKSLGNDVDPVDIAQAWAPRLCACGCHRSTSAKTCVSSEKLMQRIAENYRKIRNTFRYILGNLHGLRSVKACGALRADGVHRPLHAAAHRRSVEGRTALLRRVPVPQGVPALLNFCTVDLSTVYFDILKDRLYTSAPNSKARRSAQTALWKIGEKPWCV